MNACYTDAERDPCRVATALRAKAIERCQAKGYGFANKSEPTNPWPGTIYMRKLEQRIHNVNSRNHLSRVQVFAKDCRCTNLFGRGNDQTVPERQLRKLA
jgi:hypothetical protein